MLRSIFPPLFSLQFHILLLCLLYCPNRAKTLRTVLSQTWLQLEKELVVRAAYHKHIFSVSGQHKKLALKIQFENYGNKYIHNNFMEPHKC